MPPTQRTAKPSKPATPSKTGESPAVTTTAVEPKPETAKVDLSKFDFASVKVTKATVIPKTTRKSEPNPMESIVAASVEADWAAMEYGPIPKALAGKVRTLMHRAAREADKPEGGHGLKFLPETDNGDGTITLIFQAKKEKKVRAYTSEDVRKWIDATWDEAKKKEMKYNPNKRIPAEISKLYREAHPQS